VPVEIENIANALALAEMRFGVAREETEFSLVHAATFLGSCVVSGGEVVRGARGLSGQLGHFRSDQTDLTCVCGRSDCLNLNATGFGLIADAKKIDHSVFDTSKLALYATSLMELIGDSASDPAIASAGGKLAPALYSMSKLLAPKKIILSGYLGANQTYFDGARRELEETFGLKRTSHFELVKGEISADRSASLLALHAFYYSDRLDFERISGASPAKGEAIG
jgi:predicted NBD/HSP70 family sugar kinase